MIIPSTQQTVTLIADNRTAHIGKAATTVTKITRQPTVKVKINQYEVADSNHNPLAHYPVNFAASNGANVISSQEKRMNKVRLLLQ